MLQCANVILTHFQLQTAKALGWEQLACCHWMHYWQRRPHYGPSQLCLKQDNPPGWAQTHAHPGPVILLCAKCMIPTKQNKPLYTVYIHTYIYVCIIQDHTQNITLWRCMFVCWWHSVQLASLNLHLTTSSSGSCASNWKFWKQFWGILNIIKQKMEQDYFLEVDVSVINANVNNWLKCTNLMFGIAAETGDLFGDWVSDRWLVSTWVWSVHPPTPWTLSSQQQPEELKEIFDQMHMHSFSVLCV